MARAGGLRAALPFHTARRRGRGSERIQEPGKGHLRVPGGAKKEPDGTQPGPCLRGGAWWAHLEQSSGPSRTATEHRVRHGLSPARPRWTAPRTGARGEKSGRSNRALSHLRPLRARRTDGPAWLAPHTSPGLVWATSARLGTGPSRTLGQILLVARRTTRQTTPQLPGGTARVQNTLVPASEGRHIEDLSSGSGHASWTLSRELGDQPTPRGRQGRLRRGRGTEHHPRGAQRARA